MSTNSLLTALECPECGRGHDFNVPQFLCSCGSPLLARYDLERAAATVMRAARGGREASLWRYCELLPAQGPAVSLGEGWTPLLPAPRLARLLGVSDLWIKDEAANPTGSFKARGMAVAVTRARELGARRLVTPSAGNAGGALAAYARRAGLEACIVLPADAGEVFKQEVRLSGARLIEVEGTIAEAGRYVRERLIPDGWYDLSTLREPYRVEGKKTMGYELAEQLDGRLPTAIFYPTGGGTGLIGMWKAFAELEALGWIGAERPRMVCVQAAGCAPIARALQSGAERAEPWADPRTYAEGLRVPAPLADRLMLRALRESRGTAALATDAEIRGAVSEVARAEGVLCCPEGAATWVGAQKLASAGWLGPEDRVVLFNTGSAYKYPFPSGWDCADPLSSVGRAELAHGTPGAGQR
ncbi:MAG TPA: threonine synthase [Acidobacteriota bacterium]